MPELSIIIPFVQEWPQVSFTIRAMAEAFDDTDFEIIAIDNWCREVEEQTRLPDRGHTRYIHGKDTYGVYDNMFRPLKAEKHTGHIESMAQKLPWLKYLRYEEKLSHWQAKRIGVESSDSEYLLFVDAHVIPSKNFVKLYQFYHINGFRSDKIIGSVHPVLTYHILENKKLSYKPVVDIERSIYHYSFTSNNFGEPKEVECMSTCGMFISRNIYEAVGGWPKNLGIYGGGENFMNYTMNIMGYKKIVMPDVVLYHHGDKRGYSWNFDDHLHNKALATYIFGGREVMKNFMHHSKGRTKQKEKIEKRILHNTENIKHRSIIKERAFTDIETYWKNAWITNEK